MKFCWSTLHVKDIEESLSFYRDLVGLDVQRRFRAGQGLEIAFLGNGETKIELICDDNIKDTDVGKDISWGFQIDSVDEKIQLIKEKGNTVDGPYCPNQNTKFFFTEDPNGLRIQFVELL